MRSANAAMTKSAMTMTPPITPIGFRRAKRPRATVVTSVPDARIEHRVEGVHDEVDEDDRRDDDEVHALDDGIVALIDRVEEEAAHPGQAKDRLDDDRAPDDLRKLRAHEGDHGNDGVAQRVLHDDTALGEPLGPRGSHVIL